MAKDKGAGEAWVSTGTIRTQTIVTYRMLARHDIRANNYPHKYIKSESAFETRHDIEPDYWKPRKQILGQLLVCAGTERGFTRRDCSARISPNFSKIETLLFLDLGNPG
jgi:hypothetical protein